MKRALVDLLRAVGKLGPYGQSEPVREEREDAGTATPDSAAVRAWALEQGFDVPKRGPVPAGLIDAYRQATR